MMALSEKLITEFGRGFSVRNLRSMKIFYISFENRQTLSAKYFDREVRSKDEERTIGIILCHDKKETIARYTLPENNTQIFASKYKLYLPTEDELIREVDEVAKKLEGVE